MAASFCLTVGAEALQRLGLDPGGDVQRLHLGERVQPVRRAPAQELADAAPVGFAGIAVADVGGKEIDEAPRRRLAAPGDQRG